MNLNLIEDKNNKTKVVVHEIENRKAIRRNNEIKIEALRRSIKFAPL